MPGAEHGEAPLRFTSDAVCRVDRDWRFTFLNAAAERLLGRASGELLGRRVWDEFPRWAGGELYQGLHGAVEQREPVRLVSFDQHWQRWFEVRAFPDTAGLSVFFRDVDADLRSVQERTAESELLRSVLEVYPSATVLIDGDGTILATNRQWYAFGERKGEPAELRSVGTNYHVAAARHISAADAGALRRGFEALAAGALRSFVYDCPVAMQNEGPVWFHVQASRVDDAGRVVATHTDITQRVEAHEAALWRARHDHLTELPNRAYLHELIDGALQAPDRGPVTVLFLDLDGFKTVNDTLGHEVGDALLRTAAARLSARTRGGDVIGRLGGDEFVVLAPDCDTAGGIALADRMRSAFDQPFAIGDVELPLSASIGIATSDEEHARSDQLIRDADTAMYAAKTGGRDRHHVFTRELKESTRHRTQEATGLGRAIDGDELRLLYQPYLDLRSGAVAGWEALLRWEHPEKGLLPPAAFLPVAEETGLIASLTRWVLAAGTAQAGQWASAGWPTLVSINISPRLLAARSLVDDVGAALAAAGLPAAHLGLELAESGLALDPRSTVEQFRALRALGVRLAIDHFGAGGAPLADLTALPISTLKLDPRLLSTEAGSEADRRARVRAVVALGEVLGVDALASGVETPDQMARARAADCAYGQGYMIAAPMPDDRVLDWLTARPTPPVQTLGNHGTPPRSAPGS
jgi:diguanylate cyclase (GGDEF)-like protein